MVTEYFNYTANWDANSGFRPLARHRPASFFRRREIYCFFGILGSSATTHRIRPAAVLSFHQRPAARSRFLSPTAFAVCITDRTLGLIPNQGLQISTINQWLSRALRQWAHLFVGLACSLTSSYSEARPVGPPLRFRPWLCAGQLYDFVSACERARLMSCSRMQLHDFAFSFSFRSDQ